VTCFISRNTAGQLGDGTFNSWLVGDPLVDVVGPTDAVEVSIGVTSSCARRATGDLVCRGGIAGRFAVPLPMVGP
jgi:hypothetical protein